MKHNRLFLLFLILILSLSTVTVQAKPAGPDEGGPAGVPIRNDHPGPSNRPLSAPEAVFAAPGASAIDASGVNLVYDGEIGHFQQQYLADPNHLYGPSGLAIDSSGNLYVVEENGDRLLRFSTSSPGNGAVLAGVAAVGMHHDQYLNSPKDVALGPDGNLWMVMNDAVKVHDPDGAYLMRYPDDAPWETGEGNNRFNHPRGIAFDDNGYLFVSDTANHRVQIFDVSGPAPVYFNTIGETGVSGSDNSHFYEPGQMAFDDNNALYIVDSLNYRVQRCTSDDDWATVSCTKFFGGTWGGNPALGQMGYSTAIAIDWNPAAPDTVYIANPEFYTVYKCTLAGACSVFLGLTNQWSQTDLNRFTWISSVEVDSAGNIYVADWNTATIRKFSPTGALVALQAGEMNKPYLTQPGYFNHPWGITADASGSLYVLENWGRRLIKLNPDGSQAWVVGEPAIPATSADDHSHFGSYWGGMEGSPAVDSAGRIYVPDTGSGRVQIINPDGSYSASITGLNCPAGVAIHPTRGDILVVNRCSHNIQVYAANRSYKASIGVKDVPGSDNAHFNHPWGIAVDSSGAFYITDSENYRVQKCTSTNGVSYTCSTAAGVSGVYGQDFHHFYPIAVDVDADGRLYVADSWYPRLLVYDRTGAYLASIGGWGYNQGQFVDIVGVTVGPDGTVYVTDQLNATIQKFKIGLRGWQQVNPDGFGLPFQDITALASFNGTLYAGTYDTSHGNGAQIWRQTPGGWEQVVADGWDDSANVAIDFLYAHNGYLYAGTWNQVGESGTNGGQLRRTSNGTTWQPVTLNGFGDTGNSEFFKMFTYGGQLCASTWRVDDSQGSEVWCSDTGSLNTWTKKAPDGFGDPNNAGILTWAQFSGADYAGTYNLNGGQLWRKVGAEDWSQVSLPGEVDSNHYALTDLEVFDSSLYAIFARRGGAGAGGSLLRCQACDGTDWQVITDNGFGDPETRISPALALHGGKIYAVFGNLTTGVQLWSSSDGVNFSQAVQPGFGNSNNGRIYWSNPVLDANGILYIGTENSVNGGEIWVMQDHSVYTPMLRR